MNKKQGNDYKGPTKYIAKLKKSDKKYFVSARFQRGDNVYSGISEVISIDGKLIPTRGGKRIYWNAEMDKQILKLMESLVNEPIVKTSQGDNQQGEATTEQGDNSPAIPED